METDKKTKVYLTVSAIWVLLGFLLALDQWLRPFQFFITFTSPVIAFWIIKYIWQNK